MAVSAGGDGIGLLGSLVVILAAAGLVALVANKLRLATVPAYLITGALIGPGTAELFLGEGATGLIGSPERARELGDLAIVLLMFGIGMHMDVSMLRGNVRSMLLAGVGAIVGTILLLWPLAHMTGATPAEALVAAMALSLSSTAVVVRIYQQKRQMHRMSGRLVLAILVMQDLAVIAMLIAVPALAAWNATFLDGAGGEAAAAVGPGGGGGELASGGGAEAGASLGEVAWGVAKALLAMAGLFAFGRLALPRLLGAAAKSGSGEVLMVLSVAFAFAAAALTVAVGLSAELGAFVGGFLLSTTPFRHYLSGQVGTIRDLFIAVFFTVLGTAIDPGIVLAYWPTVLFGTVLLLAIKTLVIGGFAWAVGATAGVSLKVGASLAQAGEFGLVLLAAASASGLGLVGETLMAKLTAIIVGSLVVTTPLIEWAERLTRDRGLTRVAPWTKSESLVDADERITVHSAEDEGPDERPHVIVAGFGVVGRAVVDRLAASNATVTIVEMNVRTVAGQRKLGKSIIYGDTADPEVLGSAGIDGACALVLTIPDDDAVMRACRSARSLNPSVQIIARTTFLSKAMQAINLGANETIVEEMATAERMDGLVLSVIEREQAARQQRRERERGKKSEEAGE